MRACPSESMLLCAPCGLARIYECLHPGAQHDRYTCLVSAFMPKGIPLRVRAATADCSRRPCRPHPWSEPFFARQAVAPEESGRSDFFDQAPRSPSGMPHVVRLIVFVDGIVLRHSRVPWASAYSNPKACDTRNPKCPPLPYDLPSSPSSSGLQFSPYYLLLSDPYHKHRVRLHVSSTAKWGSARRM